MKKHKVLATTKESFSMKCFRSSYKHELHSLHINIWLAKANYSNTGPL